MCIAGVRPRGRDMSEANGTMLFFEGGDVSEDPPRFGVDRQWSGSSEPGVGEQDRGVHAWLEFGGHRRNQCLVARLAFGVQGKPCLPECRDGHDGGGEYFGSRCSGEYLAVRVVVFLCHYCAVLVRGDHRDITQIDGRIAHTMTH
ncbi:Uncharacterised protein [Mycobacteroides abscessus subsp. abscessus]|nr:Uncharacterised protein [Mycobacteroides abscessus subsp. abscessus]